MNGNKQISSFAEGSSFDILSETSEKRKNNHSLDKEGLL